MTTYRLRPLVQQSKWTETTAGGTVRTSRPNPLPQPKQKSWQAREDSRQMNPKCPRLGLLKRDILYPSLFLEPSRCTPAAAQLLPLSWSCLRNQALANLEFPNEDADLVESNWSPGSGAGSPALRVSWQTHFSCKSGSKNDWVSRMRPLAQSQKSGSAHLPPHFLHLISPLRTDSSSELTPFSFITAGVSCFNCLRHCMWRALLHALLMI